MYTIVIIKKLNFYRVAIIVFVFLFTLQTLLVDKAHAYTSPYFLTKTVLNPLFQPTQVVRKGNSTYIAEYGGNVVYKIVNGQTFNIAGLRGQGGFTPDGAIAKESTLIGPNSIDVADDGTVYIAEANSHRVRVVYPNGVLGTVAGNGATSTSREDASNAINTAFNWPAYIKIGPDGRLYVADEGVIRRIEANGSTTHVVGKFGSEPSTDPYLEGGTATEHNFPYGNPNPFYISPTLLAFDSQGRLFLTSHNIIYRLDLDKTIHTFYTPLNFSSSFEPTQLAEKSFVGNLSGLDISNDDTIWVSFTSPTSTYNSDGSFAHNNSAIYYINNGVVQTAAGGGNSIIDGTTSGYGNLIAFGRLVSISVDENNNVFFINSDSIFNPYQTPTGNYVGKLSTVNDIVSPSVLGVPARPANLNGWHNSPVNINWVSSDPEPSSGQPTIPTPTLASQEGVNTYTSGQSCDPSGNCSSGSLQVSIDSTIPKGGFIGPSTIIRFLGRQVNGTATDITSGVRRVTLVTNGAVLSSDPGGGINLTCTGTSCSWSVDSTRLPRGIRVYTLTVTDFADNSSLLVTKRYIVI